jgi:hypothetical protein
MEAPFVGLGSEGEYVRVNTLSVLLLDVEEYRKTMAPAVSGAPNCVPTTSE